MKTVITVSNHPVAVLNDSTIDWWKIVSPLYNDEFDFSGWRGQSIFVHPNGWNITLSEAIVNNDIKVFEYNVLQGGFIDITNRILNELFK